MKKDFLVLIGIVAALFAVGILEMKPELAQPPLRPGVSRDAALAPLATTSTSHEAVVIKVFDGDTIEISGGEHVRYIGMDAPEEPYSEKATAANTCYAEEAKAENENLVLGKTVRLVKDVRDRDAYGRLLRYVYVNVPVQPDKPSWTTEIFVNEALVSEGYAKATAYPPDIKYESEFNALQKQAQENKRGLWSVCK